MTIVTIKCERSFPLHSQEQSPPSHSHTCIVITISVTAVIFTISSTRDHYHHIHNSVPSHVNDNNPWVITASSSTKWPFQLPSEEIHPIYKDHYYISYWEITNMSSTQVHTITVSISVINYLIQNDTNHPVQKLIKHFNFTGLRS